MSAPPTPPRAPRPRYELRDAELNARIDELVARAQQTYGPNESADHVRQIVVAGLRLLRDSPSRGDVKLMSAALKELVHAFRVFAPWEHVRKVSVFGSARTQPDHPDWQQARAFGERIVRAGWMVITGAGHGIMGAAQGGAGREASFGVNIRLPFEQRANEVIAGDVKLIHFRYFFTRKVVFVRQSHAIALFPGGFGTFDEGLEALTLLQTGKSELVPIVFVDAPGGSYWRDWHAFVQSHLLSRRLIGPHDLSLYRVTDDVGEAVAEVTGFYRNYHSSRYVGDRLVLRVQQPPGGEALERLNRDFADVVTGGAIEVAAPLPEEGGEAPSLARVVLRFDRREVGRLRQLVDRLNEAVAAPAPARADAALHEIVPKTLPPESEAEELAEG
jgi:uncharacterized protein (TIGR00730 family)